MILTRHENHNTPGGPEPRGGFARGARLPATQNPRQ